MNDVGGCEATAPECGPRVVRVATARWAALSLPVIFGASSAYGSSEKFWVDGTDGAAVVAGVALLAIPVLATAGAVAVAVRRRRSRGPVRGDAGSGVAEPGRLVEALRLVLLLGQVGWATFMAGLAFQLTELSPAQGVGWGLAVLTFTEALGLLAVAWWAEDRLAASPRQNARTAGMAIMRDDGSTDWRTLGRWLTLSALAVVVSVVIYLAGAWVVVMNTSWCPSPWTRLTDDVCLSPK